MAFSLVAHVADGLGVDGGTSSPDINTTGADLIVLVFSRETGGGALVSGDISDSKSNTYTEAALSGTAVQGSLTQQVFFCASPSVGSGHNVTVAHTSSAVAVAIQAWSGAHASPLDDTIANASGSGTTLQAGGVTPPEDNCLIVAGISLGVEPWTNINGGFTIASQAAFAGGSNYGVGSGYLVQTSAAAADPTFTINATDAMVVSLVVFKSDGGGGGGSTLLLLARDMNNIDDMGGSRG